MATGLRFVLHPKRQGPVLSSYPKLLSTYVFQRLFQPSIGPAGEMNAVVIKPLLLHFCCTVFMQIPDNVLQDYMTVSQIFHEPLVASKYGKERQNHTWNAGLSTDRVEHCSSQGIRIWLFSLKDSAIVGAHCSLLLASQTFSSGNNYIIFGEREPMLMRPCKGPFLP